MRVFNSRWDGKIVKIKYILKSKKLSKMNQSSNFLESAIAVEVM